MPYTQFVEDCPQALSEKAAPVIGHLSEAREMVLSLKQELCLGELPTALAKCSHLERVGKAE